MTSNLSPLYGRLASTHNVTDYITPYISWTTGKDPPGTNNIFLVNAPEGTFALSSSHQIEAGVKAHTPDDRADLILSVYDIKRSNLLVQTSVEDQATADQTSKGVELSTLRRARSPRCHWRKPPPPHREHHGWMNVERGAAGI